MTKIITPDWIKAGNKVLVIKFDPYRHNKASDILSSIKEATITKVGSKFFYLNGGSVFSKDTLKSTIHSHSWVFKDRNQILQYLETSVQMNQIEKGIHDISPQQAKLIHAIMFPNKQTFLGTEEIEASLETIEWYGLASAMFPGSNFDKVNGADIYAAKEELKEVTAQFLSFVAQGILAKHI